MLRRLFTVLSAVSLLLCATAAVLWVRSRQGTDAIGFDQGGVRWRAAAEGGRVRIDNKPQITAAREAQRWAIFQSSTRHTDAWNAEVALKDRYAALVAEAKDRLREIGQIADPQERARRRAAETARFFEADEVMQFSDRASRLATQTRQRLAEVTAVGRGLRPIPAPVTRLDIGLARVSAVTAVLPAGWAAAAIVTAVRRRRLRSANRCLACGYDLRATPERCPECGAVPTANRSS